MWTSLCFTADLWTESQQLQLPPPQQQRQQQWLWPALTTIGTAFRLRCQCRQNLWYQVRLQLWRSRCEGVLMMWKVFTHYCFDFRWMESSPRSTQSLMMTPGEREMTEGAQPCLRLTPTLKRWGLKRPNIFQLMFISLEIQLNNLVCRVNQFHLTSCNLNVYFHFTNLNV